MNAAAVLGFLFQGIASTSDKKRSLSSFSSAEQKEIILLAKKLLKALEKHGNKLFLGGKKLPDDIASTFKELLSEISDEETGKDGKVVKKSVTDDFMFMLLQELMQYVMSHGGDILKENAHLGNKEQSVPMIQKVSLDKNGSRDVKMNTIIKNSGDIANDDVPVFTSSKAEHIKGKKYVITDPVKDVPIEDDGKLIGKGVEMDEEVKANVVDKEVVAEIGRRYEITDPVKDKSSAGGSKENMGERVVIDLKKKIHAWKKESVIVGRGKRYAITDPVKTTPIAPESWKRMKKELIASVRKDVSGRGRAQVEIKKVTLGDKIARKLFDTHRVLDKDNHVVLRNVEVQHSLKGKMLSPVSNQDAITMGDHSKVEQQKVQGRVLVKSVAEKGNKVIDNLFHHADDSLSLDGDKEIMKERVKASGADKIKQHFKYVKDNDTDGAHKVFSQSINKGLDVRHSQGDIPKTPVDSNHILQRFERVMKIMKNSHKYPSYMRIKVGDNVVNLKLSFDVARGEFALEIAANKDIAHVIEGSRHQLMNMFLEKGMDVREIKIYVASQHSSSYGNSTSFYWQGSGGYQGSYEERRSYSQWLDNIYNSWNGAYDGKYLDVSHSSAKDSSGVLSGISSLNMYV